MRKYVHLHYHKQTYDIPFVYNLDITRTYDDIYRSVYKCVYEYRRRYDKNKKSWDKTFSSYGEIEKKIIDYYHHLDCQNLYQVGSYLVNNGIILTHIFTLL